MNYENNSAEAESLRSPMTFPATRSKDTNSGSAFSMGTHGNTRVAQCSIVSLDYVRIVYFRK
jgi:hypothetical protein